MQCRILKAFEYAHDGQEIRRVTVGEEIDIRDSLVDGLVGAGLVERLAQPSLLPSAGSDGGVPVASEGAPVADVAEAAGQRRRRS